MAFDKRKRFFKKKICRFCANKDLSIDYKNQDLMRRFTSESGKIEPRRLTGTCAKHQRKLAREIKKSRKMAIIAFVNE